MAYRAQKIAGLVFLCVYCLAGTLAIDKYPFFNWSLFSYVPNKQQGFTIEIQRVGSDRYDPPLSFSKTRFLFDGIGQSPTEYTRHIDALGSALKDKDAEAVRIKREELENIFRGNAYTYTVLSVTYDPIEQWKTGEYESMVPLATFSSTDP